MQGGVSVSAPEFADLNLSIPPLHRWLDAVIGASPEDSVAPHHGPRRWWPGPLDVEGLALGALQAVATALHRYPAGRARFSVTSAPVAASFNSLGHLRIAGVTPDGFAELSGFFPCRDGWIRLHANYPHHAAAVRSVLGAGTRTEVVDALAGCSAEGAEATLRATGGVAVALRDPATWQASAPGAAVASEPWIRFALEEPRAGPRRAVRALSELRVLDLTRVVAGPTGTRLLGALGADVLRIDPPGMPELWDHHVDTGFAKRSALADLDDPAALARIRVLLAEADVLFTGYRGAALDRFGLNPAALTRDYPQLVVVTLDAWEDRGPWSHERGFDSIVQAATGIGHLYGRPYESGGWRPGVLPVQALDHATGYGMTAAALALLTRRHTAGGNGWAHLSLARTAQELLALSAPSEIAITLPVPVRDTPSPYGPLRYVPPPLGRDGGPLEYPTPPQQYGSSPLSWTGPEKVVW